MVYFVNRESRADRVVRGFKKTEGRATFSSELVAAYHPSHLTLKALP